VKLGPGRHSLASSRSRRPQTDPVLYLV
jgi:hypothetical protein